MGYVTLSTSVQHRAGKFIDALHFEVGAFYVDYRRDRDGSKRDLFDVK